MNTFTTARLSAGIAAAVLLAGGLVGCAAPADGPEARLFGTEWGGTDSDGDDWGLEFESDGTVGVTYNGDTYDDPADVWKLAGDTLTVSVHFSDTDVELTGAFEGLSKPIEAEGTYGEGTFDITLERK